MACQVTRSFANRACLDALGRQLQPSRDTGELTAQMQRLCHGEGFGSPVVKVSVHGRHVMSSSPAPLKTRRVGQRCTLNLSRAETSSRWCGVVVKRGGSSSGVIHIT
ncbi:uncharacterized protein TNCV_37811 [Trichonephila clavipes]|nr:uncharacterized protein TNCV_37811 [Trichonephila clavipes]